MSSPPPGGNPPRDVISRDCPCTRCGYNLRTLAPGAVCPECEEPIETTLRARAAHLAGADRRWLRALTSGVLWLSLSLLIPAVFYFVPLIDPERVGERRADWRNMTIIFTPAVLALAACWRLATREPRSHGRGDDQLLVRVGLRVCAVLWLVPLPIIAIISDRSGPARIDKYWPLLATLRWAAIPATLLLFARLKHVARCIPSRGLAFQCAAIGSQWPVGMVLLYILLARHFGSDFRDYPDAMKYAAMTPLPGVGLPWSVALHVEKVMALYPGSWSEQPVKWLIAWPVFLSVATLLLGVQFLIALIRVRHQDPDLPTYCRKTLGGATRLRVASPDPPPPNASQ